MTQIQRAIILTSIIGTILSEYDDEESSGVIRDLKFVCNRFMTSQSGTAILPFIGSIVIDSIRHGSFLKTVGIGDRIWKRAIDRYVKHSLTIEATALIRAVYDFAPDILNKHVHISKKKIELLCAESSKSDNESKRDGAIVGGYLVELLSEEMGIKINGRLRALRMKVEREVAA